MSPIKPQITETERAVTETERAVTEARHLITEVGRTSLSAQIGRTDWAHFIERASEGGSVRCKP